MIRTAAVMAIGYVLGAKAGRRRYEQIAGTYRAITGSPRTRAVIDASRRRVADRLSPEPPMVRLADIGDGSEVLAPVPAKESAPGAEPRPTGRRGGR